MFGGKERGKRREVRHQDIGGQRSTYYTGEKKRARGRRPRPKGEGGEGESNLLPRKERRVIEEGKKDEPALHGKETPIPQK